MTTSNEHNNAPAVPQGWKLVPVEPTKEMIDAYCEANGRFQSARADWAAMLAATPSPAPAQEPAPTWSLREALQKAKDALSLALSDVDWRKDSPTQPVIHKAYNCAHQALALPTAEQVDDINVAESFTSVTKTAAPAQGEPFGYFRAEPFGWTDCSEDAEGAIALYEHPAKPAQEVGLTEQRAYRLLQAGIDQIEAADEFLSDDTTTWAIDPNGIFVGATYMGNVLRPARRAIIAALRAKGGKHV